MAEKSKEESKPQEEAEAITQRPVGWVYGLFGLFIFLFNFIAFLVTLLISGNFGLPEPWLKILLLANPVLVVVGGWLVHGYESGDWMFPVSAQSFKNAAQGVKR